MSDLSEAISSLMAPDADRTFADVDGLRLITWPTSPVINVNTVSPARDLTRNDVEAVRRALAEAGYHEVDSWVASQGASWLASGVFAGVSFRIRPKEAR